MLTVEIIDTTNKTHIRRFIDLPFRLYDRHPQWAPPIVADITLMLNRKKHPFYEHSDADFFMATRDGRDVGRLAALENKRFNDYYYPRLLEALGFEKEVDFVSCYLSRDAFRLPARIHSIAERVQKRGVLKVKRFASKRELLGWVDRIGGAYNKAFVNNWEYYPLTPREIKFVVDNVMLVADHRLIKIITHEDEVVGFLFAFPDVSAALQRTRGRLLPFGIVDLLLEMRRTKWVAINGMGILSEFQGHGGNALLYSEMEKTIHEFGFLHADLTQVAESAVQMRRDLENVGGKVYKNHRVYAREI